MEYISDMERQMGLSQEPYGLVLHELTQASETGHDVSVLRARFEGLGFTGEDDDELRAIYADIPGAPVGDWPYDDVSDIEGILALLEQAEPTTSPEVNDLEDRVRGAWFGRVAGNMLGKPVEFGFPRIELEAYLRSCDSYPLEDYVPINLDHLDADGFTMGFMLPYHRLSRGRIDGGVRDDDIDYTILGLHVIETYGLDFTTEDVAREWLTRLPVYQTYTAERATYQNLVREVPLDRVGEFHNPFREWIGALIRADIFGFVLPGQPRAAAILAQRDAILSHRSNGVYGEMWAAALISSAFTASSPEASVREALRHIPSRSRLSEEIERVLDAHVRGKTWTQAIEELEIRYAETSWVHTLNNAGALAAAVLWGDGDFTATIALAVQAGIDTDSIGATAGAWAGIYGGYRAIPEQWLQPLRGRTVSAVFGYGEIDLEHMAERTLALVGTVR